MVRPAVDAIGMTRPKTTLVALALLIGLVSCSFHTSARRSTAIPPRPAVPAVTLAKFKVPLSDVVKDGSSGRVLVFGRAGRVWTLDPRSLLEPVLVADLESAVSVWGPGEGLLAGALSDDGRRLLVLYSGVDGYTHLDSYSWPIHGNTVLKPGDGSPLLRERSVYQHKGGDLVLAANGDLLVALGSIRVAGSPKPAEQTPDGVVVRLNAAAVRSRPPRPVALRWTDVVASGLRNPWRMFRDGDELYIFDVGENTAEEIDRVRLSAVTGAPGEAPNFGWPYTEGNAAFLGTPPAGTRLVGPWVSMPRSDARCAVTGGAMVRFPGASAPAVAYADWCSADVFLRDPAAPTPKERSLKGLLSTGPTAVRSLSPTTVVVTTFDGDLIVLGDVAGMRPRSVSIVASPEPKSAIAPTTNNCRLARAVLATTGVINGGTPKELERRVTALRDELAAHPIESTDPRFDHEALNRLIAHAMVIGQAVGWDAKDPRFVRVVKLLQAERGADPGAFYVEAALVGLAEKC